MSSRLWKEKSQSDALALPEDGGGDGAAELTA